VFAWANYPISIDNKEKADVVEIKRFLPIEILQQLKLV
jgi:hypothetical protein